MTDNIKEPREDDLVDPNKQVPATDLPEAETGNDDSDDSVPTEPADTGLAEGEDE